MRHAVSNLNEDMREMRRSRGIEGSSGVNNKDAIEAYINVALDAKSRDAVLSETGVKNSLEQREFVKSLDIRYILVSPMRRAL